MRCYIGVVLFLAQACSNPPVPLVAPAAEGDSASHPDIIQGPDIHVSPRWVDFGSWSYGTFSDPVVITVANRGQWELKLTEVSWEGDSFEVHGAGVETIQAGDSVELEVVYWSSGTGVETGTLRISSDDADTPRVEVALQGEGLAPRLVVAPSFHDLGTVAPGGSETVDIVVSNKEDGEVSVYGVEAVTTSGQLSVGGIEGLPWTLGAGEERALTVEWEPLDTRPVEGFVKVEGYDTRHRSETVSVVGNQLEPGVRWYVFHDGVYETTSESNRLVDYGSDPDVYWYEPSGVHGLVDSTFPEADFGVLRHYIIEGAEAQTEVTEPINWSTVSAVPTYEVADYTYVLCDFWVPPDDDPGLYQLKVDNVDDSIQVMVNGEVTGRVGAVSSANFDLGDHVHPGEMNHVIVLHVDNTPGVRTVENLRLLREGVFVPSE